MNADYYLSLLDDRVELASIANKKRIEAYADVITFSRNIFIPVTHQCRNSCAYCGFVSEDPKTWMDFEKYKQFLIKAKQFSCSEVLLTLGEKPEEKYESARKFLEKRGFKTTSEYVNYLCGIALNHQLLPHSNLGVLSYDELQFLKDSNASMGLMLESSCSRLMEEGEAHFFSPGKDPELRIETIENAGKLKIPFTTGILVGIGETWKERIESLLVLKQINDKYNHLQEIIVQNFNPQPDTPMANVAPPSAQTLLDTIAIARTIFPPAINIQVPPNLNRDRIIEAILHGANDLGGISPLSIDYINPNMDWQEEKEIRDELLNHNLTLRERLPVYPQYEKYLSDRIRGIIEENYKNERPFHP